MTDPTPTELARRLEQLETVVASLITYLEPGQVQTLPATTQDARDIMDRANTRKPREGTRTP